MIYEMINILNNTLKIYSIIALLVVINANSIIDIDDWNDWSGVIGGEDAKINQAPWQAWIAFDKRYGDNSGTGCSLIHKRAVLTAAHCCPSTKATDYYIIYGGVDRHSLTNAVNVSKVIIHPEWDPSTVNVDICVLILENDVNLGKNVKLIELADKSPPAGVVADLTGWGWDGKELPIKLQHANLTVISTETCRDEYLPLYHMNITQNMLCAESKTEEAGTGDSGGPLAYNNTLVGVVSMGMSRKNEKNETILTTVFADVPAVKKWVLDVVNKNT